MEKSTTRSVVKNAACGNNSALAKAVLKDQELKELILMEITNEIKKEIRLYSKDPACLLKLKSPADIRRFWNESFYQQLLVKCPDLAVLLSRVSQPGNLKGNLPDFKEAEITNQFQNSVCMAASICLHQYNQQMTAAHHRIRLLLLNGGAKALTLQRCAGLGISVSHSSAIRMQTKAAAPNVSKATCWKTLFQRHCNSISWKRLSQKRKQHRSTCLKTRFLVMNALQTVCMQVAANY